MIEYATTIDSRLHFTARRELIKQFDLAFDVISVDVDESRRRDEPPDSLVRRLANAKAQQAIQMYPNSIVVAADTIVALDDRVLGKPVDRTDAIRMLRLLRGRAHRVYSGVAVAQRGKNIIQVAETVVLMRDYADAEIQTYVATGDPLDKAAAYAIQHPTFHPVARIEGCYANVMGLPLCRVYAGLKESGVALPEPETVFHSYLESTCPEAARILIGG